MAAHLLMGLERALDLLQQGNHQQRKKRTGRSVRRRAAALGHLE